MLCLDPEDIWNRAKQLEVAPFKEQGHDAHPAKVDLVEMMTGRSYRDALRAGLLEMMFEIAVPVYVPFRSLVRSRNARAHCAGQFPYVVNVDMSVYSDVPIQFWNDQLVDACAEGNPAKLKLCLEKGPSGAEVNHQDCRGWTGLHAVAHVLHNRAFREANRKKQLLDILLERKASLQLKNVRGELALALAEARGFDSCAAVIRAANRHLVEHIPPPEKVVGQAPLLRELEGQVLF